MCPLVSSVKKSICAVSATKYDCVLLYCFKIKRCDFKVEVVIIFNFSPLFLDQWLKRVKVGRSKFTGHRPALRLISLGCYRSNLPALSKLHTWQEVAQSLWNHFNMKFACSRQLEVCVLVSCHVVSLISKCEVEPVSPMMWHPPLPPPLAACVNR